MTIFTLLCGQLNPGCQDDYIICKHNNLDNLIIDIGNSRIKIGLFNGNILTQTYTSENLEQLLAFCKTIVFDHALVSSVTFTEEELKEKLSFPFLFFDYQTSIPITNLYATSQTLGIDRLAAVIGSRYFQKEGHSLAIDLGTCITYDYLNDQDHYLGGAISPGVKMRFEAMHKLTARLPMVDSPEGEAPLIGNTTNACMQSGVYYGVYHEISGIIDRYKELFPSLKVFICGGDAKSFESLTKDYIFVIPNLVLYGLNRILTYNVSN